MMIVRLVKALLVWPVLPVKTYSVYQVALGAVLPSSPLSSV